MEVQSPTDEVRMPGLVLPNDVTANKLLPDPHISLVHKKNKMKPSGGHSEESKG